MDDPLWERGWTVPVALAALHLALALLSFVPTLYIGGDNGAYVSLARSLLEHGDYRELWDPAMRPHTQYPPVFPALVALGMAVGLEPWIGPKLIVLAFSAAAVGLSYLWLRRVARPEVALAVGVFLAISPGVLELSHWELSDVPFWAFTMLAMWAFAHTENAAAEPEGGGRELRWVALGALAAALAYGTRSAGLPLVVAGALWLAWRRRGRALAVFAAIVVPPALAWWLRGRAVGGAGYLDTFWWVDPYVPAEGTIGLPGLAVRVFQNLDRYVTQHLPMLLTQTRFGGAVLGSALVLLALVGWARRVRRRPGVAELWMPLYAGLVLLWPPTWSGERLVLPLLPLLLLCAAETVGHLLSRRWRLQEWGLAVATTCCAMAVPGVVREIRLGTHCTAEFFGGDRYPCLQRPWRDLILSADRLRGRLPAGSVVLSRKPTLYYPISGYRSRTYPLSADPDTFFAEVQRTGADFVVVDQVPGMSVRYLYPVLEARRSDFCIVPELSLPDAILMRIDTAGPERPQPADPGTVAFRACPLEPARPPPPAR